MDMGQAGWIVILFILIAGSGIWQVFKTRCPNCRKFFARVVMSRQVAGPLFIPDQRGTQECQCRYCGHQWRQSFYRRSN